MENITLVKDAVHRPDEPRHFMEYRYPAGRYVARIGDVVLAESERVLKLAEVGFHIYDPVIYFPMADTAMAQLTPTDKSTHCPLKGDTRYYDFTGGRQRVSDVAWSYGKPLDFARELATYIAFDGNLVSVTTT